MKEIDLSQGKTALVDDADFEWLSQWKWTVSRDNNGRTFYAYRNKYRNSKYVARISMHRAILEAPDGMVVDHINHNGLDNRRSNIRLCTQAQNAHNRILNSGAFLGVSACRGRWLAQIRTAGKYKSLGLYETQEEAAIAWNRETRKARDQYATLNAVEDRPIRRLVHKRSSGGTSRYVGVSWAACAKKWRAEIRVKGTLVFLGQFDSEREAATAFNDAALRYRGESAYLNDLTD